MTAPGIQPCQPTEDGAGLRLLDQRALPHQEVWLELRDIEAIAEAIETLAVRGAPAIGCAAALGLAGCAQNFSDETTRFRQQVQEGRDRLAATRPTAVNLFVALEELTAVMAAASAETSVDELRARLRQTATAHVAADLEACHQIGRHGGPLLPDDGGVLTHCNAGALATAGYGTALGVIRSARQSGKRFTVFADETRPVLQGARLTAWELMRDDIPVEVIADNMAGALMAQGLISAAIVGADRIARNGDVANKIGTYSVAVLCRYHAIPFYVAAPWTTIDMSLADGRAIPIEERDGAEIRNHGGKLLTPARAKVKNPAFDVTPAALITAIITERGVITPSDLARHE